MSKFDEVLGAALASYRQKRFAEALQHFEVLNELQPEQAGILSALADVNLRVGNFERAQSAAQRAGILFGEQQPLPYCTALGIELRAMGGSHGAAEAKARYGQIRGSLQRVYGGPIVESQRVPVLAAIAGCNVVGEDHDFATQILRELSPGAKGIDLPAKVMPYMTVEAWCAQRGAPRQQFAPPRHIRVDGPVHHWDYAVKGTYVCAIPNGEAMCGIDRVVTPDGIVLADSGHTELGEMGKQYFPCIMDRDQKKVIYLWPESMETIDEDVLFLAGTENMMIGHWIIDVVPRLRFLEHPAFNHYRIAIPAQLGKKHLEALAMCGVDMDKLIRCEDGVRLRFRSMLVVEDPPHQSPTPGRDAFLLPHLRPPFDPGAKSLRIFVERTMPSRRIANDAALNGVLEKFGFERIDLAKTSLAEQRTRLGAAEIAICVYGSDSLARLFLQTGADLIELTYNGLDSGAGGACAMTGINYHGLNCQTVDAGERILRKDCDFEVDIEVLTRLLEECVQRQRSSPYSVEPVSVRIEAMAD